MSCRSRENSAAEGGKRLFAQPLQQRPNVNFPTQNPGLILRELNDSDTEVYLLENQRRQALEYEEILNFHFFSF